MASAMPAGFAAFTLLLAFLAAIRCRLPEQRTPDFIQFPFVFARLRLSRREPASVGAMMTGKQILYGLGLTLALGIGCGAGAGVVASETIVPPARAQRFQRWEQICVPKTDDAAGGDVVENEHVHAVNEPGGWNPVLRRFGDQGWELVAIAPGNPRPTINAVCFKRPLQ